MHLKVVLEEDLKKVLEMQKIGFAEWDSKYHDYIVTKEPFEKLLARFKRPGVFYYFIVKNKEPIGVICVRIDEATGIKRISPIWIMPEYINQGYGQKAIKLLEEIYGTSDWVLRTAIDEERNIHFYQKLGYKLTDDIEVMNKYLTLVLLTKNLYVKT